jgi:2-phospho-L-lactate guanylyltransferase (CobY/MobA/RfbA family)
LTIKYAVVFSAQGGLFMTWIERFEETLKTPAIATPDWFECIPATQREEARRLVETGVHVCVVPSTGGTSAVLFDETEFVAGVFHESAAAEQFAATWNHR